MANISQKWQGLDKGLIDILVIFTYGYNKKRYSLEISKKLGIPNRTVSRKLNKACQLGFLKYIREGRNRLYFLNLDLNFTFHLLLVLETYKAMKFLSENSKINLILEKFKTDKIIFGSYAKNKNTKKSDLDIVFFDKVNLDNSFIEIHPQFSSKMEFRKALFKKNTLSLEIIENHIILSNYEWLIKLFMEYYNG